MNVHSVKYFLFIHRLTFLTANGPLWDLYRTLLFEFPATRLGHVGQIERRKIMPDSIQQETSRVLARACARILTSEEIARVSAGQNQTFAFTHVINPDTTRD